MKTLFGLKVLFRVNIFCIRITYWIPNYVSKTCKRVLSNLLKKAWTCSTAFLLRKGQNVVVSQLLYATFNLRFHVLLAVNVQFLSIEMFLVIFIFSPFNYFGWMFRKTLQKFQTKSISSIANVGKEHNSFANQSLR